VTQSTPPVGILALDACRNRKPRQQCHAETAGDHLYQRVQTGGGEAFLSLAVARQQAADRKGLVALRPKMAASSCVPWPALAPGARSGLDWRPNTPRASEYRALGPLLSETCGETLAAEQVPPGAK
jgi:hypothetical protein